MTVNVANALSAYVRNSAASATKGMESRSDDPAKTFAELIGEAAESAVAAGRKSEQMSSLGISGKADLNEVIAAVTNAEVTLQTVIAIRDKVIAAYQEISRMPI